MGEAKCCLAGFFRQRGTPPLGGKYFCLKDGGIVGYLFPINKKIRLTVFDLFPNPPAINTPAFKNDLENLNLACVNYLIRLRAHIHPGPRQCERSKNDQTFSRTLILTGLYLNFPLKIQTKSNLAG